ncbi:MAG: response regulator transcription factor [Thioalkalivibrio sp.]|nr:response regulator transcription factor [Thioalkalivibrio sp.]
MNKSPAVILLDDDPSMRRSLSLALTLAGYEVQSYASAGELFEALDPAQPGCLLLDLKMPGLDGLEVQEELRERGCMLPVIFISAFADIPSTVRAMKAGAVDFVEKPFSRDALVSRIEEALALDRRQRDHNGRRTDIGERAQQLTPRELEVMRFVTVGLSNKEIARELGISPRTVEKYRARVMEKMRAESIADLCQMAAILPDMAIPDQDSLGSA